jgi:pre-mRNA-processing factor 6
MTYGIDEISTEMSEKDKIKAMKRVWTENAEACINKGSYETARAIYFNAIHIYP